MAGPARTLGAAAVAAVVGTMAWGAAIAADAGPLLNDPNIAFTVEVSDVAARVGEATVLRAKLRPREGYRVLEHYNNRVTRLSTQDQGVTFPSRMVLGSYRNGELEFAIPVKPTKPGRHAINGVFRVGYAEGSTSMRMISVPLMTGVTGTE